MIINHQASTHFASCSKSEKCCASKAAEYYNTRALAGVFRHTSTTECQKYTT